MKTYNVKTYRSVLFELNHCVKAEDKASAMDQCINWFQDDREIMDHVPDWIDPVEYPESIEIVYVEEEEDVGWKPPEEFEHELIGVLQEHYGENFDYNWDSEEDGFYIRLRVWGHKEDG